ncbi:hypothetical protein AAVH_13797 [Aphelenchoides avenae]|nr:hypothetical protein AAVH_13797 [Aphelenchus avenae]
MGGCSTRSKGKRPKITGLEHLVPKCLKFTYSAYARHEKKGNIAVTIGLNNVLQPDGRTWRWEWVDGSTATFTNWEYGNPVEADPNAPTQNCAAMSLRDGQWFSDYKWNIATPLCERRPNY